MGHESFGTDRQLTGVDLTLVDFMTDFMTLDSYDLQSVLGAEKIVRRDLATAIGASAAINTQVQPFDQIGAS